MLQSLFTWIFYLFIRMKIDNTQEILEGFNPYSPGFSIYFKIERG